MGKDLVHVHVSDSDRLLPGEGRVNWFGLMQTLQESQFDGYVTMGIGLDSRFADLDKNCEDGIDVNSFPNPLGIATR